MYSDELRIMSSIGDGQLLWGNPAGRMRGLVAVRRIKNGKIKFFWVNSAGKMV